jgi:hypothetical protein
VRHCLAMSKLQNDKKIMKKLRDDMLTIQKV